MWKLLTINMLEGHDDGKWDMTVQGDTGKLYVEEVLNLFKDLTELERLT